MPQALAFLLPATFAAGGSFALLTAAGSLTFAGIGVSLAGSLLLSVASSALAMRGNHPTAANVQTVLKQAVGQRMVHVGRVRAAGTIVFQREKAGVLYTIIAHGQGEIDAIEAFYLDRKLIAVDGAGVVTTAQYQYRGTSKVSVLTRRGIIPETAYAEVTAIWPEWTANHRLDGIWSSLVICRGVPQANFEAMYPNRAPSLEMVARGVKAQDPRSATTDWTDNAALLIGRLFEDADGFNRPGLLNSDRLVRAADDCDDAVAVSSGGTEARYRLWGSYGLAEKPQDVLERMRLACGGRISLLPDATIAVDVGVWRAPAVTLSTADVIELSEYSDGPDLLDRYNTLPFTYVDPDLTYQQIEGDPWVNEAQLLEDGEQLVGTPASLDFCPSHGQGRRAAKIQQARANPTAVYTLHCQPSAIIALFEQFIELDVPAFGAAGYFEIQHYEMNLDDGSITYVLNAVDPATYDWSTTDEGQPQALPIPDVADDIPAPEGFVAAAYGVETSTGIFAAGIGAAWAAPVSSALSPRLEWRASGASAWDVVTPESDPVTYLVKGLSDSASYDVRLAFVSPSGQIGTYASLSAITAGVSVALPSMPAALTVTDLGGGQAQVSFTAASSANLYRTDILRGATVIATFYAATTSSGSFIDGCGAGTFNWFARSINVAQSANATDRGPVTQTIT